jgi:hypothetical protein
VLLLLVVVIAKSKSSKDGKSMTMTMEMKTAWNELQAFIGYEINMDNVLIEKEEEEDFDDGRQPTTSLTDYNNPCGGQLARIRTISPQQKSLLASQHNHNSSLNH